jgi:uncharacterized membrane protein YeaQ/YmgE (transglycosylase-associated protein family)
MRLRRTKAQSTLEYAAIIAVVVGAIIALNIYMKRGVEGQLRGAADDVGAQYDINSGSHYSHTRLGAGQTEIQRSMMGKNAAGVFGGIGAGFVGGGVVGSKEEAQFTEQAGQRWMDEISTTNVADASAGANYIQ